MAGRIGFTGPYSDVNFGDYAMLVNNLLDLGRPPATVFTYHPEFVTRMLAYYLPDSDVRVVDVSVNENRLAGHPADYAFTPAEILALADNLAALREHVRDIDVMVVSGGGYFNDLWALPHRISRLLSIMLAALVADEQELPVVFTGNGYGPFNSSTDLHSAFFGGLRSPALGCRDQLYSPVWMRQLGLPDHLLRPLPDDLLFINENLTSNEEQRADPYILLETYLPIEVLEPMLPAIRVALERIRTMHGRRCVFVPFNIGAGGEEQGRLLARAIPELEVVDVADTGFLPVHRAAGLVANADFVVSSRYHAQVLAVGRGTPSMGVLRPVAGDRRYYYNKNVGLLRQVLRRIPFQQTDYAAMDLPSALDTVARDFTHLAAVQREQLQAAAQENLPALSRQRMDYLHQEVRGGS